MQTVFGIINKPLGYLLEAISRIFNGNFAAAVFVFTLIINIVLIPISIKSQKSSVQQTRIKPKLDDLKKRYGDDKQKYNEAMQKMYQEEGVSMSGGCLPMILRLVIMMSIYYLILSPLTYLMHIDSATITSATEALKEIGGNVTTGRAELSIIKAVQDGSIKFPEIKNALGSMNFNFLGINLTEQPVFSINIFNDFQKIWLMPIIAFLAQMFTSAMSLVMQKKINPDAPNMAVMMLTMPLMSLWIGFNVPGGVAFYWACSSLIGGFIQLGVQNFYGPHKLLSRERTKELVKQCDFETEKIKKFNTAKINGETDNK